MNLHIRHAQATPGLKQMHKRTYRELPGAALYILFLKQHGRYLRPLVQYLDSPSVCGCVNILSSCISLNTSHIVVCHSPPPNGIIHCSLISYARSLCRRLSLFPHRCWDGELSEETHNWFHQPTRLWATPSRGPEIGEDFTWVAPFST